ncbi:ATP-binding protein [Aurantimonas sp. VKM B-3413]|uniref:ATP-binding protein n=1 Tax=Aurantimonas sp. VKM B-3413 TaxID=2779401 RepID=UPI001E2875A8|nr:ATP-binding protein [Aurantimonas sp. VKM B-3413]MCB8838791.1 two-component sensor histidine kinase [Aurantimonas sp. VKM B-3413]
MKSLRSRLAILLVAAILGVVAIAGLISVQVLERPDRESFQTTFAEEVRIIATVLAGDPEAAQRLGIDVGAAPMPQHGFMVRESGGIRDILAQDGLDIPVSIVGDAQSRTRQLAFEFAPGRWAYLPYPGFPPRNRAGFIAYLALIAMGAAAVSIFAATKMTRPLRILDEAVSSVGPDGLPAHVPEDGPAEVRATASALNRLTARVRATIEGRMRLVAAAGHDLRTPMTRMRLRAEFLPEEERETWLKDLAELDRIADSAIRLVREEVDPTAREPIDLGPLITEITGELEEIGHPIETVELGSEPPVTSARPLALKRALRNLIDNAAVHGGGASVALAAADGEAVITITDNGPGIPEELIGRAFEPFFRVDPGRRQLKPGAGLGMAIAKEIIDQAGGSIRIANRNGGGLTQTVRLPLAEAAR